MAPGVDPFHMEQLERKMRAMARTITARPISTPSHAVMAEADLMSVAAQREALAARFLAKALALPQEDPLRRAAEVTPSVRLKSTGGWRSSGREVSDRPH